ncbi:sugar kinase [Pseudonocardia nigra]|uniref:sugar kinase n=1 Tax=Pseudonocardia nigra TaxID=1921578 RepID=UPI001C604DC7|nr:sugar kinase [Pseudonocardia nigra]
MTSVGSGLVTLGETMGLLGSRHVGPLRHADGLTLGVGGAESNVAIGVTRLGGRACWVGRVGDDPIGDLLVNRLAGEQVDVSCVVRDSGAPTSLMVKELRTPHVARVTYYRTNGPGARLQPEDIPHERVAAAQVLHITGITPALSAGAGRTVLTAVEIARAAGVTVSVDVNYRSTLWSPDRARPVLRDLVARADIAFAGDDEADLLGLHGTPAEQAAGLAGLGPGQVVIKLGARGAVASLQGRPAVIPARTVVAVDPVGAGDAFVAGFLADHLRGAPPEAALRTAASCGAFVVQMPGDWEGLPTRAELALLDAAPGTVLR